ncbi:hypothetical protein BFP75_07220 [Maribacter sp. 4G9]|nr:hypothetical protein BFP75_07220 [Maribacter sp. 4G9]
MFHIVTSRIFTVKKVDTFHKYRFWPSVSKRKPLCDFRHFPVARNLSITKTGISKCNSNWDGYG